MTETVNVHATGLVLGGAGVIVRGPSGSGKSLLALLLLDDFADRGLEAMLVADDRLDLSLAGGVPVMAAPPAIAGLIELRGRGILSRPYLRQAQIDLVVDLVPGLERMPDEAAFSTQLLGVTLRRCPVPQAGVVGSAHQILLVREALAHRAAGGTKTA